MLLVGARSLPTNCVGDTTEDEHALILVTIRDHCHALVTNVVESVAVVAVLDLEPNFLVEQKQMQVVQKRRDVLLAQFVVATTGHEEGVICGQVTHGVAEAGARGVATSFDVDELTVNHLAVNRYRFEIAKFVAQKLSVLTTATEEINALLHHIALRK